MSARNRLVVGLASIALFGLVVWFLCSRHATAPEPVQPPISDVSDAPRAPEELQLAHPSDAAYVAPFANERHEAAGVAFQVKSAAPLEIPTPQSAGLRFVLVPRGKLAHDTAQLVGRTVALEHHDLPRQRGSSNPPPIQATIAADLSFEFPGLSPDQGYSLDHQQVDLSPFAPVRVDGLILRAGELTRIELPLEDGLVVAGRVLDENGHAVPDLDVRADWGEENEEGGWRSSVSVETDSSGAFRFEGLSPLLIEIRVDRDGYLHTAIPRSDLGPWSPMEDLEIRLSRGRALSGIVRLPDGRKVAGAQIGIDSVREGRLPTDFRREAETATNAGGYFRASRLYGIRFTLTVTARIPPEALAGYGPVVQALGRHADAPLWSARRENAALAPTELEIVLAEVQR